MTSHVSIDQTTSPTLFADGKLLEEIRTVLKRPDLGDDVLLSVLSGSAATRRGIDHFSGTPQDRAAFIRTLPVPAPVTGWKCPITTSIRHWPCALPRLSPCGNGLCSRLLRS